MKPAEVFSHWGLIRRGLMETIERFEESELGFRAAEGIWSTGQVMVHIANTEEGWFRYVITRELSEWPEHLQFANYPSKESILDLLNTVHSRTTSYLESLGEDDLAAEIQAPWDQKMPLMWIIWHVIEHEIHHRGELSLILGLLGRQGLEV